MRAFVVLGLFFFHTKPRDWLGETSPKWPVLCRVGRKTTTQSISQCAWLVGVLRPMLWYACTGANAARALPPSPRRPLHHTRPRERLCADTVVGILPAAQCDIRAMSTRPTPAVEWQATRQCDARRSDQRSEGRRRTARRLVPQHRYVRQACYQNFTERSQECQDLDACSWNDCTRHCRAEKVHNPFPRLYIAAAVIQCSYVVSNEPFPAQVGYQFSCADFPVISLDCTASEMVIIIIFFSPPAQSL